MRLIPDTMPIPMTLRLNGYKEHPNFRALLQQKNRIENSPTVSWLFLHELAAFRGPQFHDNYKYLKENLFRQFLLWNFGHWTMLKKGKGSPRVASQPALPLRSFHMAAKSTRYFLMRPPDRGGEGTRKACMKDEVERHFLFTLTGAIYGTKFSHASHISRSGTCCMAVSLHILTLFRLVDRGSRLSTTNQQSLVASYKDLLSAQL